MVAPELRSRARRYGYTGKTKEQMLADLTTDGDVGQHLLCQVSGSEQLPL